MPVSVRPYRMETKMQNVTLNPALVSTREALRNSWRRSAGETVQLVARNGSVRLPSRVDSVNTGAVILGALTFFVEQWGVSVESAKAELVTRWLDMLDDPNFPGVDLGRIDYVLDLNTLVTGEWME